MLLADAVELERAARSEATAAEEEEGKVKLSLKGSSEGEEEGGRRSRGVWWRR